MSEWQEMRLGDVLTLQRGFDLPKQKRVPGPYPVVSSSGVTGSHDEYRVQGPGVVIGRYGSLGSVHWVDGPFWPLNTSLWVKDFKGNDPRFVSYLLQTVRMDGSAAAAVPGVNRNHLHEILVLRPDVTSQRRIASMISALVQQSDLYARRMALLEGIARAYYDHQFEGTAPAARLGDVGHWKSGGTPTTAEPRFWNGRTPWISSGSLTSTLIDDSDRRLTSEGLHAGTRTVDRDAVICVVRGMSLLKEFRVGIVERTVAFGQDCKAVVAGEGIEPLYLAFAILAKQRHIQGMVELAGHGTGKLSSDRLYDVRIPVPSASAQQAFVRGVSCMRDLMSTSRHQQRVLALMRARLVPRLVTGRLSLDDIDLGRLTPDPA